MKKITPPKDAYGQDLAAFLSGQDSVEIVERDDGFLAVSRLGAPGYFDQFSRWSVDEQKAIHFVYGKVLDMGTGGGRVALYLQEKGFDVLAVDSSPLAIQVCKKRGVKKVRVVPLEDLDTLPARAFDTVVLFGQGFGLFQTPKKLLQTLKKIEKITTARGQIIAQSLDPYVTSEPAHLHYHTRNRRAGKLSGQIKIRIRSRQFMSAWFYFLLVSEQEIRRLLKGSGWEVKKVFKSKTPLFSVVLRKKS